MSHVGSILQPSVFILSVQFRGLESNQRPLGSEPSVTTSSNYPGADSLIKTTFSATSSGRRTRTFVSWFKARQPTASRSPNDKSCGGRNRTCDRAVNSRPPVPTQDTANRVRVARSALATSCSRGRRSSRLSYTL
jgi:hypothetical protein